MKGPFDWPLLVTGLYIHATCFFSQAAEPFATINASLAYITCVMKNEGRACKLKGTLVNCRHARKLKGMLVN